jgi:hypothetical protein
MIRKSLIFLIVSTVLFSFHLYARDNSIDTSVKNQGFIDKGRNLDDRMNRLGTVLVDYIEKRIKKIKDDDWKELRIEEGKLYLLLLFNRLDMLSPFNLEEFKDPLRLEIYKRLANAMGRAIEDRDRLLRRIEILYFDVKKLKKIIEGTGKSIIAREHRRQLGLLKAENAVYEIFLSVNREDGTLSIGGKIVTIETGNMLAFSDNYNIPAQKLLQRYPSYGDTPVINVNKIKPPGVKTKKLNISKIWYQGPGSPQKKVITKDAVVKTGGKIWFEISLKEPGGYLLGYLKDSHGKAFNLFPGTRNAVINGDYRVPFNLDNPFTDIQEIAAGNIEAAVEAGIITDNTIIIGGYTFDDKPGHESFSFFYTDKRISKLESIVKEARNIGKDLTQTKGV